MGREDASFSGSTVSISKKAAVFYCGLLFLFHNHLQAMIVSRLFRCLTSAPLLSQQLAGHEVFKMKPVDVFKGDVVTEP